jgi:nitrite reductase (NADH) small subunit/3-phenylpropionate/trans-cinnamate dioxygenase ferredoxin subunit
MGKWQKVANLTDLKPGDCLSVEAGGAGIALFNVNGTIYALDNTCPHAGGPLGEGFLEGHIVECPWHGWRYDVKTGERPENRDFKVACYRVQVEGNEISLILPEDKATL